MRVRKIRWPATAGIHSRHHVLLLDSGRKGVLVWWGRNVEHAIVIWWRS